MDNTTREFKIDSNESGLIDLHVHSTASDGSLTPTEVLERACERGLKVLALTDHDTVDGVPEIVRAAKDFDIEVIPGIEMSAYYGDTEIHILGFFADYENEEFRNKLKAFQAQRNERNVRMIELFQKDGIDMTMEKVQFGNPNTVITRAHFARALVDMGVCKDKEVAFRKFIGKGCKYYLPKSRVSIEEVMPILEKYTKGAFLAHPLIYHLGYKQLDELFDTLIPMGLKGVECYHSSTNRYEVDRLRGIAAYRGLAVSGGSDFHGAVKPNIELAVGRGNLRIPYRVYEELEAKLNRA